MQIYFSATRMHLNPSNEEENIAHSWIHIEIEIRAKHTTRSERSRDRYIAESSERIATSASTAQPRLDSFLPFFLPPKDPIGPD